MRQERLAGRLPGVTAAAAATVALVGSPPVARAQEQEREQRSVPTSAATEGVPISVATELSYHLHVIDDWPLAVAPAGYHWAPKPRPWLLDVGLGIWAAAYVPAAATATLGWKQNDDESYGWQLIPVAGSFLELHFATDAAVRTLLVADGAIQILGGAVAAAAYIFPSRHLERDVERNETGDPNAARVTVLPVLTGQSAGLTVSGTF